MPSESRQPTILVVDDNVTLLDSVCAMMQMLGWRVVKASSGLEGLAAFQEVSTDIDLILLDLLMPDIDGFEVIGRLREQEQDVPVIMATGISDVPREEDCPGPDAWLRKPFRLEQLQAAISAAMREA